MTLLQHVVLYQRYNIIISYIFLQGINYTSDWYKCTGNYIIWIGYNLAGSLNNWL